jgi:hypothetical protein
MPDERERLMESRPNGALPKDLNEAAAEAFEVEVSPTLMGKPYSIARLWFKAGFEAGAEWREALRQAQEGPQGVSESPAALDSTPE